MSLCDWLPNPPHLQALLVLPVLVLHLQEMLQRARMKHTQLGCLLTPLLLAPQTCCQTMRLLQLPWELEGSALSCARLAVPGSGAQR